MKEMEISPPRVLILHVSSVCCNNNFLSRGIDRSACTKVTEATEGRKCYQCRQEDQW